MRQILLDCDQVFEVLTRGPFPSGGADDEGVEHHLRACHECRQLAEALRPAVSLMHEALAVDGKSGLPVYAGSLPQQQSCAFKLLPVRRQTSKLAPIDAAVSFPRLLAACLLVAALGALMYGVSMKRGSERGLPQVVSAPLRDGLPDQRGLLTLAALKLPSTCLPTDYRPVTAEQARLLAAAMAESSQTALRCCTECHYAGASSVAGGRLVALVAANCQACHRG